MSLGLLSYYYKVVELDDEENLAKIQKSIDHFDLEETKKIKVSLTNLKLCNSATTVTCLSVVMAPKTKDEHCHNVLIFGNSEITLAEIINSV